MLERFNARGNTVEIVFQADGGEIHRSFNRRKTELLALSVSRKAAQTAIREVNFPFDGFLPGGRRLYLEESHPNLQRCIRTARHQTLGAHFGCLGAAFALAVIRRDQHTEVESALILDGGRAVWVEDIPFIEDGVGDAVHELEVHCRTSSSTHSRRPSSVCSQVGMPRWTLYW